MDLLKKALELPEKPGVYIMHNAEGRIIYVGKAKILKNRVVSYFRNGELIAEDVKGYRKGAEDPLSA